MSHHHHHHHHEYQRHREYEYDFKIVSEMNQKVLDIQGGDPSEHTKVIMYDSHPDNTRNQLWYVDQEGILRSALNGMVFFAEEEGHHLKMVHYNGDPCQQWRIQGNTIVNGSGKCLDIKGGSTHNSAELCAYHYNGQHNQHWRIQCIN